MTNEELVTSIRAGKNTANDMLLLWDQNKGIVARFAKKYTSYAEFDDLMQEGYIGLCNAAMHYDSDKDMTFVSYAVFWIRQAMQRYIDNCGSVIRIPVQSSGWTRKYKKIVAAYEAYCGEEPTERELCAFLGVGREKLCQIQESLKMGYVESLDAPIQGMEDITLGDAVSDGYDLEEETAQSIDRKKMSEGLLNAVEQLPEEERKIIRERYFDSKTRKEIDEENSRLLKFEQSALRRLKARSRKYGFRYYYDEYMRVYRHVRLSEFKRTWTSSTEKTALNRLCTGKT